MRLRVGAQGLGVLTGVMARRFWGQCVGFGDVNGAGAWSFGSIQDWCLRFWGSLVGSVPGEFWECSTGSVPGALGVFKIGSCVFGNPWWGQCLESFGNVPRGQCLELWEYLGLVPAVLGMQRQGLEMFGGVATPGFRNQLWGRCPGFWECLAP